MSMQALQRKVVIRNPNGFHVRPAAAFVAVAGKYQSQVSLTKGDLCVDGRRALDLIMLAAEPGTELLLEVKGEDAAAAIEELATVLGAPEPPVAAPK